MTVKGRIESSQCRLDGSNTGDVSLRWHKQVPLCRRIVVSISLPLPSMLLPLEMGEDI